MIDYLFAFANETAARADSIVGAYFNGSIWNPSLCIANVIVTSAGSVIDANWRVMIGATSQIAALDSHAKLELSLDRTTNSIIFTSTDLKTWANRLFQNFEGADYPRMDIPYPTFPRTVIAPLRNRAGVIISGFGSIVTDAAMSDSPYGSTALQYTTRADGGATTILPTAALGTPLDVTTGNIGITWKPITNYTKFNSSLNTFELRLYSAGTPASPSANYHARSIYATTYSSTAPDATTPGRWQTDCVPNNRFTAVGSGADMTAITYASITGSVNGGQPAVVLGIGDIYYEHNPRAKGAVIWRIDDACPSAYTKGYPALWNAFGKGLMMCPGACQITGFGANGKQTIPQLVEMLAHGSQLGSQSYSTEDSVIVDGWDSATRKQDYVNARNYGLQFGSRRGTNEGSYYSNVGSSDMTAFPELSAVFRTILSAQAPDAFNPPMPEGETFPFSDRKAIKCFFLGAVSGSIATTLLRYALDRTIADRGVLIIVMHDDWGTNPNVETACNDAIAYIQANPTTLECLSGVRELLSPYNNDPMTY